MKTYRTEHLFYKDILAPLLVADDLETAEAHCPKNYFIIGEISK